MIYWPSSYDSWYLRVVGYNLSCNHYLRYWPALFDKQVRQYNIRTTTKQRNKIVTNMKWVKNTFSLLVRNHSTASATVFYVISSVYVNHRLLCSFFDASITIIIKQCTETDYLQKPSNAVELNCSLSGGSARNSLHPSSAFSVHSLEKKSIAQTTQIADHVSCAATTFNEGPHSPINVFLFK